MGHGSGHGSAHGSAHGLFPFHDDEHDSLVEEVSPVKPKNPSRRAAKAKKDEPKEANEAPKEWIVEEKIALCQGWCDVSENNISGNSMKAKGFWKAVSRIGAFCAIIKNIEVNHESGTNDLDVYHKACAKYKMTSMYKIIAKIISCRIALIIEAIVDSVQYAFIMNRQILDGLMILNEVVHTLKRKKKKAMIFKVDIAKAYDTLSWDYLIFVIRFMGFGNKCVRWIKACLESARSSVLVNGSPTMEFQLERGLRQGDPLAPFLFVLAMEGFHIAMEDAIEAKKFIGINIGDVCLLHLIYADDVIVVGEWSQFNLQPVIDKFSKRLSKWRANYLSIGGRSILISAVLGSLPTYYLLLFRMPRTVYNKLKAMRSKFFWGAEDSNRKIHWVKWDLVLASKDRGVIIVKYLSVEEKTALITVLKSHKRAIAWKLSDINGIDPKFCTHKFFMEEDFEPAVQHQRRLNPKIHDVIKQEVIKLLGAGLIYLISDSPWVSPVHCVPKKGGFTVVENEDNELILTRLVMGWRICIDYRKLNKATHKDHFPLSFMDQMLERLAGNQYYCFLNGFSGYFQIPIDPKDQEKTTFTCPYGTFPYRRMPFRLCNAPGENHASWSNKLKDALWAFQTTYKTPIGCTSYKLVYEKAGHLPIELEYKAYWALKHANFDLKIAVNYNQGNTSYRPPMMSNQIRPPGFPPIPNSQNVQLNQRNNQNRFNQNQNQGNNFNQGPVYQPPVFQPPAYQAPAYQAPAPQTQGVSKEDFLAYVKANDAVMRNMQTQAYKTPTGCTPYKLVYGKACHLSIELEHKAYWALKHANFDLKTTSDHRKVQLNELNELRDQAYENSLIYKEKTKRLHDSKIKDRVFNIGDRVLLFNSRLNIFSDKLKSHWSGPFTISHVYSYGTVELAQPDGPNFKVNGHHLKHYFGEDVPNLVVPDLQTFPKDY
nr:reverse transcriptase domain-containing protein [Tanacetum cinerariifolium]